MKKCIYVDLDGTLSTFDRSKNPYDRDFENDIVSIPVLMIIHMYNITYPERDIIFLSGRNDKFINQTKLFLDKHLSKNCPYILHMRQDGDFRKDTIIKEEMHNKLKNNYEVDFVMDDRLCMVRLWDQLGIFCFNCNTKLLEF